MIEKNHYQRLLLFALISIGFTLGKHSVKLNAHVNHLPRIEDDFQENEVLARQFEVAASCVVVVERKYGVVLDYKRLDDAWSKMKDTVAFNRLTHRSLDQATGKLSLHRCRDL